MPSNPNEPRYMYNESRKRMITEFHEFLCLTPEKMTKSCLNCDNFVEQNETCTKFNARPPARIIAYSCEHWENIDDQIPF